MTIEKLNALKTSSINQQLSPKQQIEKPDNKAQDKRLNESAKYMIGATALAGAIAVGIIGHKMGWFRRAAKEVIKSKPKSSENTGKFFSKKVTKYGNEYDFIRKLENGNTIVIHKEKIPAIVKRGDTETEIMSTITRHSLKDKSGQLIYETFYDAGIGFRGETLFDYDNMTSYTVSRGSFGVKRIVKQQFKVIEKGTTSYSDETPIEYSEFEKIRREILDKTLPPSLNRLKTKFLKQFEHKIVTGDKEFIRSDNGTRRYVRRLDAHNEIKYINHSDGTSSLMIGSNPYDYCFNIDKINGKLVEFESVTLPDERTYRKYFDEKTNQYVFERCTDHEKITEEEFNKKRNYILAKILPDGITSKIDRKSSLPKNSEGSTIIKYRNDIIIEFPDTGIEQYQIKTDNKGKILEYKKFDTNRNTVESGGYSSIVNAYYVQNADGSIIKKGTYEECGLDKFEYLIKDTTGILD